MPDLCLDKHVTSVSAKCYFQLRQLRRVRRSLDKESVATLVHAFVTSRIDYCNGLLAGAPKVVTDKLQRVMNSAARIVSNTRKFDHGLTHVRHDILHWLDVPERVTFKLCMTVYTEWDLYICRRCAGRARRRLVVVICVLITVVNSSFPATG